MWESDVGHRRFEAKKTEVALTEKHNKKHTDNAQMPLPLGTKSPYRTRGFEMAVAFFVVLLFYAISGTPQALWKSWNNQNDEAGYCMMIPVFALIFVYMKWQTVKRIALRPTLLGLILIVLGILMRMGAEFGQVIFIKVVALVFILAGVTWCIFGTRIFKHLAFPFAYLLFMTPPPPFLYNQVARRMMAVGTVAGEKIMKIAGIDVYRSGNQLRIPEHDLEFQVAEACSGMNSLLVLIAVAVAFAYITKRGLISRIVLSLSAIPIAIGMNMLRIAGVGILAVYVDRGLSDGFAHMAQGFLMFLAEMVILFFEGWVIGWILGRPTIETSADDLQRRSKKQTRLEGAEKKKTAQVALSARMRIAFERIKVWVMAFIAWVKDVAADYAGHYGKNVFRRMSKQSLVVIALLLVFVVGLPMLHALISERITPVPLRQPFHTIERRENNDGVMTNFITASFFAADGQMMHPHGTKVERIEGGKTFVDKDFVEDRDGYRWIGFVEPVADKVLEISDNDDSLNLRYFTPQHRADQTAFARTQDLREIDDVKAKKYVWNSNVAVYVSYHESAVDGINKGAVHFPDECYPASGHNRVEEMSVYMDVPGYCGGRIEIIRYIYKRKNHEKSGKDLYLMVTYHMNNNGVAVVDRSAGKIDNWLKLVMGKRTGFMAQVQFNTFLGLFPASFDPSKAPENDDEKKLLAAYNARKNKAWKRIESFGPRFLEKLGDEFLPEPVER